MRNNTAFLWVLLLVHGVFVDTDEVKSVSVMEGDSVTLKPDLTEIQRDNIIWKFGNVIIAQIIGADATTYDDEVKFKDRLKLDKQTGSLTIRNIKTEHVGLYSVDVKGTDAKRKKFDVTVHDVVESVSVLEGDTVTLHTGVTDKQRDDLIVWKFNDEIIRTDGLNTAGSNQENIDLNEQNGDLNIKNIRRDQTGEYKVEINTSRMISHRKLFINNSGVFSLDGVKKMSVTEGDPVTLQTRITNIPGDDVIQWTFGPQNTSVVKTDRENGILLYNDHDKRFKDRMHMTILTGDLKISNTDPEVSGLYHLKIIKSTYTLEKSFSVTVTGSDRSGAVSGISGASVGLMVWAVAVFLLKEV